jgi:hypothetical protein
MKPRWPLPAAPLTPEDAAIWTAVALVASIRHGTKCLWDWAAESDEHDHRLMLYFMRAGGLTVRR